MEPPGCGRRPRNLPETKAAAGFRPGGCGWRQREAPPRGECRGCGPRGGLLQAVGAGGKARVGPRGDARLALAGNPQGRLVTEPKGGWVHFLHHGLGSPAGLWAMSQAGEMGKGWRRWVSWGGAVREHPGSRHFLGTACLLVTLAHLGWGTGARACRRGSCAGCAPGPELWAPCGWPM